MGDEWFMGKGKPDDKNESDDTQGGAACGGNMDVSAESYPGDAAEGAFGDSDCSWQSHVHEFLGNTGITKGSRESHNHRFAGVSGEAIYVPGSHVHRIEAHTDFYYHFHDIRVISGPATFLLDSNARKSDRKHVHFVEGFTLNVDHHRHDLEFATLIEAPLDSEDDAYRD
jgi:hypothetical protein